MIDEYPYNKVKVWVSASDQGRPTWHWRSGSEKETFCGQPTDEATLVSYTERTRYNECENCKETFKKMK